MNNPHPGFTLAQLIETTANELRKVRKRAHENRTGQTSNTEEQANLVANDEVIRFTGCELELAVTVSAETGGGIKFWVVDASGKVKGETLSKIKLYFDAIDESIVAAAKKQTGKGKQATR